MVFVRSLCVRLRASYAVLALAAGAVVAISGCDPVEDGEAEGGGSGVTETAGGTDDGVPANEYCTGVEDWPSQRVEFEEEVLVLVNEARAAGANCGGQSFAGTGPLSMQSALRCAARVHSQDMGERMYFDHNNPEGEDPFVRMERAGYVYSTAGENIAAGSPTPASVMDGWMNSPGHCSNIMNPAFTEIGVGLFETTDGPFPTYWTQAFGTPL